MNDIAGLLAHLDTVPNDATARLALVDLLLEAGKKREASRHRRAIPGFEALVRLGRKPRKFDITVYTDLFSWADTAIVDKLDGLNDRCRIGRAWFRQLKNRYMDDTLTHTAYWADYRTERAAMLEAALAFARLSTRARHEILKDAPTETNT